MYGLALTSDFAQVSLLELIPGSLRMYLHFPIRTWDMKILFSHSLDMQTTILNTSLNQALACLKSDLCVDKATV